MVGTLGIVIVNYRTAGLVVDCLRSLAPEVTALPGARVVVVENGSGDDSSARLHAAIAAEGFGGWATLLEAGGNRGFSAGNNVGLRALLAAPSPPSAFLLLNPDTLVRPGALAALLGRLEAEPRAGIVGSRLEHPDGAVQESRFRFPSVWSELDRGLRLGLVSSLLSRWALVLPGSDVAARADWVSGASLLVRRAVLEEVGLMDEGFFLYFEEVELCRRARRAGWDVWYEPAGRVVHLVGKSTGVEFSDLARPVPDYILESRRRYFVTGHGRPYAALADLAWLTGHLLWRLRMRLQRRAVRLPPGLLGQFLRHSALRRGA
jgi:hypothetical protein